METLFCIFGWAALISLIIMMGQSETAVKVLNSHQKKPETDNESQEWTVLGYSSLVVIGWFFWGLFTSQWFVCAVYLTLAILEAVIKKAINYSSRTRAGYVAGIAVDCLVVLFIIVNILWLHIDVYHLIF